MKTITAPWRSDEFGNTMILIQTHEKYIYTYSFERDMKQVFQKIDVTDFSSSLITTTTTGRVWHFLPLSNNKILAVMDLSRNDQPALIDEEGNVEFLLEGGNVEGGLIKL
jgi:hypothetical protein